MGCAATVWARGNLVMYSIYLAHRDPDHWRDPDAFSPDAFPRGAWKRRRPPSPTYLLAAARATVLARAFAQVEARGSCWRGFSSGITSSCSTPGMSTRHMGATL